MIGEGAGGMDSGSVDRARNSSKGVATVKGSVIRVKGNGIVISSIA